MGRCRDATDMLLGRRQSGDERQVLHGKPATQILFSMRPGAWTTVTSFGPPPSSLALSLSLDFMSSALTPCS